MATGVLFGLRGWDRKGRHHGGYTPDSSNQNLGYGALEGKSTGLHLALALLLFELFSEAFCWEIECPSIVL